MDRVAVRSSVRLPFGGATSDAGSGCCGPPSPTFPSLPPDLAHLASRFSRRSVQCGPALSALSGCGGPQSQLHVPSVALGLVLLLAQAHRR